MSTFNSQLNHYFHFIILVFSEVTFYDCRKSVKKFEAAALEAGEVCSVRSSSPAVQSSPYRTLPSPNLTCTSNAPHQSHFEPPNQCNSTPHLNPSHTTIASSNHTIDHPLSSNYRYVGSSSNSPSLSFPPSTDVSSQSDLYAKEAPNKSQLHATSHCNNSRPYYPNSECSPHLVLHDGSSPSSNSAEGRSSDGPAPPDSSHSPPLRHKNSSQHANSSDLAAYEDTCQPLLSVHYHKKDKTRRRSRQSSLDFDRERVKLQPSEGSAALQPFHLSEPEGDTRPSRQPYMASGDQIN